MKSWLGSQAYLRVLCRVSISQWELLCHTAYLPFCSLTCSFGAICDKAVCVSSGVVINSKPETVVESRSCQRWVLYEQKGKWPAFCGHSLLLRGTIRKLEHDGRRVRKVVLVKILRFEKVL